MKHLLTILISGMIFLTGYSVINAQPVNDNYAFATVIPHTSDWCSADAAYTTVGATSDLNAAACWNTSPNYNVWFRFQANSSIAKVTIMRGGSYGSIRGINVAIWESDGLTEVACKQEHMTTLPFKP